MMALSAAAVGGCGPGAAPQQVDGWALAWDALLDGESCYAEHAAYCITERAFVEAAVQDVLDARFDGAMPKFDNDVERVIRSARIKYAKASQEPEGLAQISELVTAHYADPPVDTSVEGVVNVDVGALPGELSIRGRVPRIALADSPLIERFWWQGAEAGRVLAKYAQAHPQAAVVRVELVIPKGAGSDKHLIYRYFRERGRVAFGERGKPSLYLGEQTSLEAMAAGKLDLSDEAREFCSLARHSAKPGWCPGRDRYLEAQR